MGNVTEFERVANLLMSTLSFEQDINVSVFETNIRGIIIFVKSFITDLKKTYVDKIITVKVCWKIPTS